MAIEIIVKADEPIYLTKSEYVTILVLSLNEYSKLMGVEVALDKVDALVSENIA